jgi:hypothetical protein
VVLARKFGHKQCKGVVRPFCAVDVLLRPPETTFVQSRMRRSAADWRAAAKLGVIRAAFVPEFLIMKYALRLPSEAKTNCLIGSQICAVTEPATVLPEPYFWCFGRNVELTAPCPQPGV